MWQFGVVCLLLLGALGVESAPNPENEACHALAESAREMMQVYMVKSVQMKDPHAHAGDPTVQESVRALGRYYLGVDVFNDTSLERIVCRISACHTLHDVAAIVPVPYDLVHKFYVKMKRLMTSVGGVAGVRREIQIAERLSPAAAHIGFPDWPLRVTYEDARDFLRDMVRDFGPNFLSPLTEGVPEDMHPPDTAIVVNDPDKFAKELVAAENFYDFVFRMGYNLHEAEITLWYVDTYLDAKQFYLQLLDEQAFLQLLQHLRQLGLLNLAD